MKGITAVTTVKIGNPIKILLIVLRMVGNSLNDSYTGTLFYAIFGRNI